MSGKRARIFDAFCAVSIIEDRDLNSPPGACADGARYLIAAGATGLWATHDGKLAIAVGANAVNGWYFCTVAVEGVEIYIRDENAKIRHNGAAWIPVTDSITRFQDLQDVDAAGLADGDIFVWDQSNGLFYPLPLPSTLSLDNDVTLASDSTTQPPTVHAVKSYISTAVTGLLELKGSTDCSANPNYPAASKGDAYVVTVAGKIGGASGSSVAIGDVYFATADNAGGTQGSVGTSWDVLVHASVAAGGGLLAANNLSDLTNSLTALTNLGLSANAKSLVTAANYAAMKTLLGLVIGTDVQAYDADLTTYAGISPSANVQSLLGAANYAAMKTLLGLVIGTDIPARNPSIQAVVSSATVTPTFADDQVNITAQAVGLTLANPTGTAVDGWGIVVRIKDNGSAQTIGYGTQYRALGVTLPSTTVLGKTLYLAMVFNNADTKWDVVAVAQQA